MIKAIPVMAALAIAAAAPAVAQDYRTPPESPATAPQSGADEERGQQARTPENEADKPAGTVETLRERGMSAPNVSGDRVPEDPSTGVPRPEASGNPKELESTPRP